MDSFEHKPINMCSLDGMLDGVLCTHEAVGRITASQPVHCSVASVVFICGFVLGLANVQLVHKGHHMPA